MSDAANQWNELYRKGPSKRYPDEAVVRIFLGTYPNLRMPRPKAGDSILDVGFGDGCNFQVFRDLGLHMAGLEITEEIVDMAAARLCEIGIRADLVFGTCANMPWKDATFDYLLTWNSCYYMGPDGKFEDHVAEMARVLKPGGWIVCSVPKENCFIFDGAEWLKEGYVTIRNDYFSLRNGEVMRRFRTRLELESAFGGRLNPSGPFTNFCHASIDIDMFDLAYNWHVIVAQRT